MCLLKYCSQNQNFIMKLQAHQNIFKTFVYVTSKPTILTILEHLDRKQLSKSDFLSYNGFRPQFTAFLRLKL